MKNLFINLLIVAILIASPIMANACLVTPYHVQKSEIVKIEVSNSMDIFNNIASAIESAILKNVLFEQSSIKDFLNFDSNKIFDINIRGSLDTIFNSINPQIPMC